MNMYNVEGEFQCPECGILLTDFQMKDQNCMRDTLDFRDCDSFYTSCPECNTWVTVEIREAIADNIYKEIKRLRMALTAEHYNVTAKKKGRI